MISALYIAIFALLLAIYKIQVIKIRRQYTIWHGDGGFFDLQVAIRIERYALDIFPTTCLLMLTLEMNSSNYLPLHVLGIMTFLSRLIHSYGLKHHDFGLRKIGVSVTLLTFILLALFNLYYLPWRDFIVIE
ncbi:MAPEG family protein [Thorsellia kenyensis]|uniref:MAPEG family protein n=1 Tax=Thorsellia kenyensis TaxID=1549888 RepID=A0ABV6CBV9_9GAMM